MPVSCPFLVVSHALAQRVILPQEAVPKPCARLSLVLGKTFGSHVAQCWPGAFVCRMLNTSGAACVGFNYGGDSLSSAA